LPNEHVCAVLEVSAISLFKVANIKKKKNISLKILKLSDTPEIKIKIKMIKFIIQ